MTAGHNGVEDILPALGLVLDIAELALQRELHEPRVLEIRERVAALRDLIVDHWADQAERENERLLDDDNPF